jgi:hypothetical protein
MLFEAKDVFEYGDGDGHFGVRSYDPRSAAEAASYIYKARLRGLTSVDELERCNEYMARIYSPQIYLLGETK